ncbi:MAG: hypothetical protein QG641_2714 [Candidatus Poribacteria bacterium]|nr:hypothetical protein [Candidatus Poribacteria bacterium]
MISLVTYNPIECQQAIERIKNFLESYHGRRQVFILVGLFGSGKSWCINKTCPDNIVNFNLTVSQEIANKISDNLWSTSEIISQSDRIGPMILDIYTDIINNAPDILAIDNIEILYKYPYFDFITTAEKLAGTTKKVLISIPGFVLDNSIYFVDKHLHNMSISGRLDRYFELKGESI